MRIVLPAPRQSPRPSLRPDLRRFGRAPAPTDEQLRRYARQFIRRRRTVPHRPKRSTDGRIPFPRSYTARRRVRRSQSVSPTAARPTSKTSPVPTVSFRRTDPNPTPPIIAMPDIPGTALPVRRIPGPSRHGERAREKPPLGPIPLGVRVPSVAADESNREPPRASVGITERKPVRYNV